MIPTTTSRDEHIANFAKQQPYAESNLVTLQECDFCGWLEWVSSAVAPQPSVRVERMEGGRCQRCSGVSIRNPEVFNWVLSVLVHHEQGGGHGEPT
jgi:hypothetical protein